MPTKSKRFLELLEGDPAIARVLRIDEIPVDLAGACDRLLAVRRRALGIGPGDLDEAATLDSGSGDAFDGMFLAYAVTADAVAFAAQAGDCDAATAQLLDAIGHLPGEDGPDRSWDREETSHLDFAREVIRRIGHRNLIAHQGSFWAWTGRIWRPLDDLAVKYATHAVAEGRAKITGSLTHSVAELARQLAYRDNHEFDPDQGAEINIDVQNGRLSFDGSGWQLRPHRREDFNTSITSVAFDPESTCPKFDKYLDEVFAPDADAEQKKALLLELFGYSMTKSTKYEKFAMLLGESRTGKSVALYVLENLIGKSNCSSVLPEHFESGFYQAQMNGKLANIVGELEAGSIFPDQKVKKISTGESFTAGKKFQQLLEFRPFATVWFGTNHLPRCKDNSDAVYNRTGLVKFNRVFAPEERDSNLKYTLAREELPGILNRALAAFAKVLKTGAFTEPPSTVQGLAAWAATDDPVRAFIAAQVIVDPKAATPSALLVDRYANFAHAEDLPELTTTALVMRLCALTGATTALVRQEGAVKRVIEGIRLHDLASAA